MPYDTKRTWIATHARCLECAHDGLDAEDGGLRCPACGHLYRQSATPGGAIDFLDDKSRQQFGIIDTQNVSDHPFDGNALAIIERCRSAGGAVLDCGSGYKETTYPHVVQMEIASYPSVDVLAVNQRIPFSDGAFDAVFSLDVLEHVDDPFTSAAELVRVLRPGGLLYIDLPFLQHEHGYPEHYFNATRSGLRRLFRDLDVVSHHVPRSGAPIFTVASVLEDYRSGLAPGAREAFSSMTVGDLLSRTPIDWLGDPIVTELSADAEWMIASTTQALLRKPHEAGVPPSAVDVHVSDLPGFPAGGAASPE